MLHPRAILQPIKLPPGDWRVALILAGFAAVPRLVRPDLAEYKLDESTAVLNALSILHQHVLPTQGQGSSLAGAAQGPLFYYIVAAVLAVGQDPRAVVLAFGLANALAIGLSYSVISRAFNARVGLLAAILFAGSSWSIVFSRKIWPNDLLAPLAVVALWGLLRALDSRTRTPGLGLSWLAVAAMGSLNLSAWPVALLPALVQVVVPRTRRGQALIESLLGLAALAAAVAIEAPTFSVLATDLTAGAGHPRTFDLSPLSFIVQLVGTDAFQYLAGPVGTVSTAGDLNSWFDAALRLALFLGAAVALVTTALVWLKQRRPSLAPELLILLWWVTPAVAALYRPVPVLIHHFLATMPCQFILVAIALDWLTGLLRGKPVANRVASTFQARQITLALENGATAFASLFAIVASVVQIRTFALLLVFVQMHPSGTYFGVPLGSSLVAASQASAAARGGPVYVLSDGDLVGVDGTPTVMASLADGARLNYLNVDQTLLFPAATNATYLVAPDSLDDLGGVLTPWQGKPPFLSPLSALPGGYLRFRGRPVGQEIPLGWRRLDVVTSDQGVILGYQAPRQIQNGASFEVDVLWRIGMPAPRPDQQSVFAHLVDDAGHTLDAEDFAPLPTTTWVTGVGVLNRFQITAPTDLQSGRYWIDFGRYRRPGIQPVRLGDPNDQKGSTSIRLGPLAVPPPMRIPDDVRPAAAVFGDQIGLTGQQVTVNGDVLRVGLVWKALKPPSGDYTVFVHVVAPDGKTVAQSDSQPQAGQFPTITWQTGDKSFDVHDIPLTGVPPGQYHVDVGLYTVANGQRLPVNGSDSYSLGQIQVPAAPTG